MTDITEMIRRDIVDDGMLKVHGLSVDTERKGFLGKHWILHVSGTVHRERERNRIEQIVNHHAGDSYTLDLEIAVEQSEQTAKP